MNEPKKTEITIPMNYQIIAKNDLRASFNEVMDFIFNGTHVYPNELMFKLGAIDAKIGAL